jgi:hypothetical protein
MEVENVQPLPAMDNWAGAIQHAVTVTRPDPSRAEMALAIMCAMIASPDPNWHSNEGEQVEWSLEMADDLIAALQENRK